MPRLLRGVFRKRRELLLDVAQCAAEAVAEYMKRQVGAEARPGIVVSIATSGDLLQGHPHGHILATDGAFSDDGAFHPLEAWDSDAVMRLFRERLLARLIERHAIFEELARRLRAWRHPGFSAHVGDAIPFEDKKAMEDVACYIVRNPLSLKKLVVRRARVNRAGLIGRDRFATPGLDGQKAVLYRSKMNPSLGSGTPEARGGTAQEAPLLPKRGAAHRQAVAR
jgi:putative transposase